MNLNLIAPERKLEAGPLRVLIADAEPPLRQMLQTGLRLAGYDVVLARDGVEAMAQADQDIFCALIDWQMPGADGFEVLRFLKAKRPELPVIIISATGQLSDAVQAIKAGAAEFISKPLDLPRLLALLQALPRMGPTPLAPPALPVFAPVLELKDIVLGDSLAIRQLRKNIRKLAPLNIPILLLGESGVGKGLVARLLHQHSTWAAQPFITKSSSALLADLADSEQSVPQPGHSLGARQRSLSRFEMAQGGTLFLDEISQLPLALQPRLVNVLEELICQRLGRSNSPSTNIRLITATDADLVEKVARQEFRADLFFRINAIKLVIPPLRQRREDILPLAESMLAQWAPTALAPPLKLASATRGLLTAYAWPGNVRELQNVLLRATVFCDGDKLQPEHFPAEFHQESVARPPTETAFDGEPQVGGLPFEEVERMCLRQTLAICDGNKAATARRLGCSEKTVYNRLSHFGMR